MTENEQLLAKAASLKVHLGKMMKAVHSFNAHMTKAHEAHHTDLVKAFGHLHKMVGIEPGEQSEYGTTGGEPKSTSLEGTGTKNLQDFGGGSGDDAAKGAKRGDMTKAELSAMFEEMVTKLEKRQDEQFETMLKAITGADEEVIQNNDLNFKKASGVGDRSQVRQPVQQIVEKTEQTQQPGPVETQRDTFLKLSVSERQDLMQKALQGDPEARKAVMGNVLPHEVPNTLIAPLSKIH